MLDEVLEPEGESTGVDPSSSTVPSVSIDMAPQPSIGSPDNPKLFRYQPQYLVRLLAESAHCGKYQQ